MRSQRRAKTALKVCGGLLLLWEMMPVQAGAAPVTVACRPSQVKIVASALDGSTRSATAFGNIPEAQVNFVKSGSGAGCAIVTFTARVRGSGNPAIRAFMDNTTAAVPGEIQSAPASVVSSFVFVFPSVAPGAHIIRMQYRNASGGDTILDRHTTHVAWD